jgi:hypothetical protein
VEHDCSATKFKKSAHPTTMTRRKDQESAEKEARLQQAIVEYNKRQKKSKYLSIGC